jgi:15-cis-phytoene synthase
VTPRVDEAYATCRAIAKEQAKNFYYAFLALPNRKRNAMCAVYAFMRHADDLSDDESIPIPQRRVALASWMNAWRRALAGEPTQDPVFVALLDTQKRFGIPLELLDQLVEGTATDLNSPSGTPEMGRGQVLQAPMLTYSTFTDLYRYCYLVASVVGLVCIRIFGYKDPRAEKLAEETGVAFQLTNILRDVREDAERGRVYLPVEDLQRAGISPEQIPAMADRGGTLNLQVRQVLALEAQRARDFYKSAQALLPLISRDSRAALWVLVTIYSRLLQRIEQSNFNVFSAKISVPDREKLAILGQGILKAAGNRLLP